MDVQLDYILRCGLVHNVPNLLESAAGREGVSSEAITNSSKSVYLGDVDTTEGSIIVVAARSDQLVMLS